MRNVKLALDLAEESLVAQNDDSVHFECINNADQLLQRVAVRGLPRTRVNHKSARIQSRVVLSTLLTHSRQLVDDLTENLRIGLWRLVSKVEA